MGHYEIHAELPFMSDASCDLSEISKNQIHILGPKKIKNKWMRNIYIKIPMDIELMHHDLQEYGILVMY